jgi:hypothetical protein
LFAIIPNNSGKTLCEGEKEVEISVVNPNHPLIASLPTTQRKEGDLKAFTNKKVVRINDD